MIGTIVCKADDERDCMKGYIAMLAVSKEYRKRGIGLKVDLLYMHMYICTYKYGCQCTYVNGI